MSLINKNFIYKEKFETATKFKEDNLKSIISFTLDSWHYYRMLLWRKCIKYGLLSKHWLQREQQLFIKVYLEI